MPGKPISTQEIREHVAKIELSDRFDSVVRQRQILRFLVDKLLEGRGDTLTEQLIAKEVFNNTRGVVAKVEVSRLRTILGEYYGTEGQFEPLRLSIPKRTRTYTPEFSRWPLGEKEVPPKSEIDAGAGRRYITIPPLPAKYVPLSDALASLRRLVMADHEASRMPVTAIHGMGGVGKSVLAKALCGDELVQRRFPDGIAWISIGKDVGRDVVTSMRELAKAIDDRLDRYDTPQGCTNQYRTTIRTKAALIVLDDVWRASDLEPFLAEAPFAHLLYTSRKSRLGAVVGAQEYVVIPLDEEHSQKMLAEWSGYNERDLPDNALEVIRECRGLPLALSIIGSMLAGQPQAVWQYVRDLLTDADLDRIQADFPDYPDANLFRVMQISVAALDPESRERYVALAVLPEDMLIHPIIQQQLWNVRELDAFGTSDKFVMLSLAERDGEGIRLHDLQVDYLRARYPDRDALSLIRDAVQLSYHVLATDPSQFASQLLGRLLYHDFPFAIQQLTTLLTNGGDLPWLRPLRGTLHPPGGFLLRTLEDHNNGIDEQPNVSAVAIYDNGKRALSSGWHGKLVVWDLDDGTQIHAHQSHSVLINRIVVTTDGSRALSASSDSTLKVWDLETGLVLLTIEAHQDEVLGVAVTPDGRGAVSVSGDKTAKVWDLETRKLLFSLEGHRAGVKGVAITPNGKFVATGSADRTIRIWNLETGAIVRILTGHSAFVPALAVSPDGNFLVSASWDTTLKVWDLETGAEMFTLEGHADEVVDVAITYDGRQAVSGSADKTVKVWDLETGKVLCTFQGHSDVVHSVAVTPDGKRAISGSSDGTLKLWRLDREQELEGTDGHDGAVSCLVMSSDTKRAMSGSTDGTVIMWDTATGAHVMTYELDDPIRSLALTPDGRRLICASSDGLFSPGQLSMWDLETGEELLTLEGHDAAVNCVSVTPDGTWAVSTSVDETLMGWDLETGKQMRRISCGDAEWLVVTSDATRLVIGLTNGEMIIFDFETGEPLRTIKCHAHMTGLAVTHDGQVGISAFDTTMKVWDLETGEELLTLEGHDAAVNCVSVTPDGKRFASASEDKTLKVWDLRTGKQVGIFTVDAPALCCAFADNTRLVAGDREGTVHFLLLDPGN